MTEDLIIKRGEEEIILNEKRIKSLTSKYIEACGDFASISDDFGINSSMVKMLCEIKKNFFPETKKADINITSFDTQLKTWMEKRKMLMKENKEEEVIEI